MMRNPDLIRFNNARDDLIRRDLAHWYGRLYDDMEYPNVESPDELTDQQFLEMLSQQFLSGDCGDFAIALNELTGWQLVNLVSPTHGRVHSALLHPTGEIVDFQGFVTLDTLGVRYGIPDLMIEHTTPENLIGRSDYLDWDDGEVTAVDRAKAVMRLLDYPPFTALARLK